MTVTPRLSDTWTSVHDEQLRAMARDNTPWRDVAARLARTPEAVFKRAYELGITGQKAGAASGSVN